MTGQPREFGHPDEVLAFLDGIRQRNQAMVERYERFAEQAGGLSGEAFSSDGGVRVVVDENGQVATVDIADAALRHGGLLAGMILGAIREAQAARALKLAELGTELGGVPTVDLVREAIPEHVRDIVDQRPGRLW
ncbi:YbaB/EbfC family nucleoid-associated protein [Micromonospora sp. DR5-3]|uniref:YbaB/EbfC family nucleoid-associated protein n=1 Tax=unclassified Micromonospora TaxID=2617518 RepID=UPI0011D460AA|nr:MULTISPECIES: YbaB/EbfC family nucleoid-associated protein [unclassified Micromonospora]MCW3817246.1 YbaB/EbfC family nucleoid-associated protein [Micromonospora sp. DR5-3]TYC26249.1 YbaB/EbfC family nucleoid-associated protein [Micromonospora sp. MP36]